MFQPGVMWIHFNLDVCPERNVKSTTIRIRPGLKTARATLTAEYIKKWPFQVSP